MPACRATTRLLAYDPKPQGRDLHFGLSSYLGRFKHPSSDFEQFQRLLSLWLFTTLNDRPKPDTCFNQTQTPTEYGKSLTSLDVAKLASSLKSASASKLRTRDPRIIFFFLQHGFSRRDSRISLDRVLSSISRIDAARPLRATRQVKEVERSLFQKERECPTFRGTFFLNPAPARV